MNFWQIFQAGGVMMYILFFCSTISITIIVERLLYFRSRSKVSREEFMEDVLPLLEKNNYKQAIEVCLNANTPFAHVAYAGLKVHTHSPKEIQNSMERTMMLEMSNLERFINIEGTIGSTAVYIGLLGTVLGIIRAFNDIAHNGAGGINVVTQGISEALICTAAGLCVAVPAVIAYNHFINRIDRMALDMEIIASETADILGRKK